MRSMPAFASGAFVRDLSRIAVPIGLQNLIVSGVNLVDTIMVGRLGSSAIAAVGLANQIYFLLLLFLFGIGSGASIFSAQYWGKGDIAGLRRTVGLSLLAGLVVGAAYTAAAVGFPEFVLGLYTEDPAVIRAGAPYLRSVGCSYLAVAVTFVFSLALRSVERVRLPLAGTLAALTVNVALNYALIFGKWGFPELGILGAGIATSVARWLEVFIIVGGSYAARYAPAGRLREFVSFGSSFVRQFVVITSPVVANEVVWSLGMTVYSGIFARVSTGSVAAYNILQTVVQLLNVLIMGTSNAAAVMIGKKIGSGDLDLARRWARHFALMAPILGGAAAIFAVLAVPLLPFVFSVEAGVLAEAGAMLVVFACFLPAKSYNLHFIVGIDRAGGDTRFGLFFDVFGVWGIGVPAALLGAFVFKVPAWGVYLLATSEELAKIFLAAGRLKSGKWLRSLT
jgi:putative MATE family efflux protein